MQDLYSVLNDKPDAKKVDYMMQRLWRNTSSSCDIIGPYYSSTGTFKAKYMIVPIMDALQNFEAFGFHVSVLIVDGASANLSMFKISDGHRRSIWSQQ